MCKFKYLRLMVTNTNDIREEIKVAIKMCKFKYLGVMVTNTNDIREEIKRTINMGNVCYYSLEKILSSRVLSRKLKVNTCKTIILAVVLYGCRTWSLTLRKKYRLRLFLKKVLRKTFGARETEFPGSGESYIMLNYMHCILHLT